MCARHAQQSQSNGQSGVSVRQDGVSVSGRAGAGEGGLGRRGTHRRRRLGSRVRPLCRSRSLPLSSALHDDDDDEKKLEAKKERTVEGEGLRGPVPRESLKRASSSSFGALTFDEDFGGGGAAGDGLDDTFGRLAERAGRVESRAEGSRMVSTAGRLALGTEEEAAGAASVFTSASSRLRFLSFFFFCFGAMSDGAGAEGTGAGADEEGEGTGRLPFEEEKMRSISEEGMEEDFRMGEGRVARPGKMRVTG